MRITDEALQRIRGLLEAAQNYGIGITFEPDGEGGWKIGYIGGMGGGDLASGYDLETAVKAAQLRAIRCGLDRSSLSS